MDMHDIFKKLTAGAVFTKRTSLKPKSGNVNVPSTSSGPIAITNDSANVENQITSRDSIKKKKQIEIEKLNRIRKKNNINVHGNDVPSVIENFEDLKSFNVSHLLIENIKQCGYETPTPIQMQAIPAMLKGKQILACAPTGSGKTLAFLVPIVHQLNKSKNEGFRAVIISPTRELSRQTYRECVRLSEGTGLRIHITTKMKDTVKNSSTTSSCKYDLLITTPNRLVFLLNQEPAVISLKNVEWLIVDESDKLFETGVRGFRDQLATIYQACDSENVKRAMFSATHTVEVAKWCRKNLHNLVSITIGHRNTTVDSVEQRLIYVGSEEGKLIAMRDLIYEGISPPVLIFLQSKERARDLCHELLYDGINVDMIHADRTQLQRDNTVRAFREGKIWVLICTELMGRGIDFKGVNLVINYDFPPSAISYIHRIGRTGRAGRTGKAVTFYTDEDKPYLKSVVNVMKESGCDIPEELLNVKKPHKKILRKLEKKLPARGSVVERPHRYKNKKNNEKGDEKTDNRNAVKRRADRKSSMKGKRKFDGKKVESSTKRKRKIEEKVERSVKKKKTK